MSQHSSSGDQPDRAPHDLTSPPPAPAPETPSAPHPITETAAPDAEPAPDAAPAPASEPVAESAAPAAEAPAAEAAPVAEAEALRLPESFDELALPDALRSAIARIGWKKPTPVQALSFEPLTSGRDVLVQSHTGSGKTGAFCIPWLTTRFDPRPATQTGVQLLVLLPTRELAKQVCEELKRLAVESPVEVLPIYGGTPMQPQLSALRAGVHAVVGTPGRVLDHIRRRSLDLSKVATVVLDECDEMLSMGFLEDIRAILDACTGKHQTALFSATIPNDIQRIAKRYMQSPQEIQLSGDQVAAAEIEHAYYIVNGAIKTRDLLDVIATEEPARAIIFCNTREDTKLVASVLRREGYHAEELSSDLTQAQREKVMGLMREHKLRFLVATDVAARGIDITHVTHVINYSFPEAAEVYIHRTGRTGRAGRTGTAISLIHARELGNFYYLKLQYETIQFKERFLPPPEQLTAQRMEVKLDGISKRFPELVSPEWVLLARNLMADPRGERVIGLLLDRAMKQPPRPETLEGDAEQRPADAVEGEPREEAERQPRESRDLREGREPREPRREFGDRREGRWGREGREGREGRRDFRDRPPREGREFGDRREPREPREGREFRDRGEGREGREFREPREGREPREPREVTGEVREPAAETAAAEPRSEAREPRGEGREFRSEGRSEGREPRGEFRGEGREPRSEGREPRGEAREPRGEGREPRGEGREFRGESRGEGRGEGRRRRDRDRFDRRDRRDDRGPRPERREDRPPRPEAAPAPAAAPVELAAEAQVSPAPAPALVQSTGEVQVRVESHAVDLRSIPIDRRGRRGDRGRFVQWVQPEPGASAAVPGAETSEPASEQVLTAPVATDLVDAPGELADDLAAAADEGRRRRRRKRRRKSRPEGAPGEAAATDLAGEGDDEGDDEGEPVPAAAAAPVPPSQPPQPVQAGAADDAGGDARRKRRRKRRGRPGFDGPRPVAVEEAAPPAPPITPVPVPKRLSQDEIVIDIDEAELEVVTSEFGELDNIDEFALMDRRQAVIETLQEEVELEDVSRRDAQPPAEVEAEVETEDDDEAESAEAEAGPADAAGDSGDVEGEDGKKRRRRRRRKKSAPPAPPELTAPPHKDFWEVWASKFTYKDFEDEKVGPPPNLEPEPAPPPPASPPPPPARSAPVSAPPPPRPARPAPSVTADADDAEFTKVQLSLGRVHGHKSSGIRNLLREYLGLEGRAIRDLTVRDTSTLFRIHQSEVERCQGLLTSVQLDGVAVTLERAEGSREDLRAPLPEDFDDARREPAEAAEPTEIRLDPLEFESVLPAAAAVEEPTT